MRIWGAESGWAWAHRRLLGTSPVQKVVTLNELQASQTQTQGGFSFQVCSTLRTVRRGRVECVVCVFSVRRAHLTALQIHPCALGMLTTCPCPVHVLKTISE